jgi:hypothetical protein
MHHHPMWSADPFHLQSTVLPNTKTVLCSRAYSIHPFVLCSTVLYCDVCIISWESGKHVFNSHFRKGMDHSPKGPVFIAKAKGEVAEFVVSSPIFLLHFFSFF